MEPSRSETLRPEFSLPSGRELKKAALVGLAHADAQKNPRKRSLKPSKDQKEPDKS